MHERATEGFSIKDNVKLQKTVWSVKKLIKYEQKIGKQNILNPINFVKRESLTLLTYFPTI